MRPLAPRMAVRLSASLALVACVGRDDKPSDEGTGPRDSEVGDSDPRESDAVDTDVAETDVAETDVAETDAVDSPFPDSGGDTDPADTATPEWSDAAEALLAECVVPYTGPGPRPRWPGDTSVAQLTEVTSCMDVPEDEACPAPDAALPWEALIGRFCVTENLLCVTGFVGRADEPVGDTDWDTALPHSDVPPTDRCCYTYVGRVPDYACGRPLVQDGEVVTAPVVTSRGWSAGAAVTAPRADRLAALDRWRADAAAEHASVAAFSRLVLQLLHHGAPAHLVEGAVAAMADEVRHAEAAFAIVSALSGVAEGPGPLAIAPAPMPSLVELAVATAVEGGVGESLAAGVAAARLARATDPRVRTALAAVVEEEARHAGLAWAVVDWCVERGGAEVREAVGAAVAHAVAAARRAGPPAEATVPALGLPGPDALRCAWDAVLSALG